MDFGQLLAGAGAIGKGWREEEDAQRRSRMLALQAAELERLDRMRQEALKTPMPQLGQNFFGDFAPLPVEEVKPTAPAPAPSATPAPAAPVPTATPAPAATAPAPVATTPTTKGKQAPGLLQPTEQPRHLTQIEKDQIDLSRIPTATLDMIQYPAAVGLNLITATGEKVISVGGRLINAITGKEVAPTDVQLPRWSLTPFYDRFVRQREQVAQRAELPPTPQLPDMQRLLQAMIQVESAGNPKAVSKKGAVGLMQVMPETAMNPGFGLPNIFDFAEQLGVKIGRRNEAEAKRLLADPKIGAEYGMAYMAAMLQRYNNNLDYALAAYNAGPGRVDKWIDNKNADLNKLPKETRDYVAKIKQYLSGQMPQVAQAAQTPQTAKTAQTAQAAQAAQTPQTAKTAQTAQAAQAAQLPQAASPIIPVGLQIPSAPTKAAKVEPIDPSQFYLASPNAVTADMQRVFQQREDIARLAEMYRNAGMGLQYMETLAKVRDIDNSLLYLHGMQGLQELELMNDPRRLSAVWSQYAGVPIGVQPRTDGRWNIYISNKLAKKGVTKEDIAEAARSAFDTTYRQQKAEASRKYNEEMYKTWFDIQKENAKQMAQMAAQIATEKAKGNIEIMKKELEQQGIKVHNVGENYVIITIGNEVYAINLNGQVVKIGDSESVELIPQRLNFR